MDEKGQWQSQEIETIHSASPWITTGRVRNGSIRRTRYILWVRVLLHPRLISVRLRWNAKRYVSLFSDRNPSLNHTPLTHSLTHSLTQVCFHWVPRRRVSSGKFPLGRSVTIYSRTTYTHWLFFVPLCRCVRCSSTRSTMFLVDQSHVCATSTIVICQRKCSPPQTNDVLTSVKTSDSLSVCTRSKRLCTNNMAWCFVSTINIARRQRYRRTGVVMRRMTAVGSTVQIPQTRVLVMMSFRQVMFSGSFVR